MNTSVLASRILLSCKAIKEHCCVSLLLLLNFLYEVFCLDEAENLQDNERTKFMNRLLRDISDNPKNYSMYDIFLIINSQLFLKKAAETQKISAYGRYKSKFEAEMAFLVENKELLADERTQDFKFISARTIKEDFQIFNSELGSYHELDVLELQNEIETIKTFKGQSYLFSPHMIILLRINMHLGMKGNEERCVQMASKLMLNEKQWLDIAELYDIALFFHSTHQRFTNFFKVDKLRRYFEILENITSNIQRGEQSQTRTDLLYLNMIARSFPSRFYKDYQKTWVRQIQAQVVYILQSFDLKQLCEENKKDIQQVLNIAYNTFDILKFTTYMVNIELVKDQIEILHLRNQTYITVVYWNQQKLGLNINEVDSDVQDYYILEDQSGNENIAQNNNKQILFDLVSVEYQLQILKTYARLRQLYKITPPSDLKYRPLLEQLTQYNIEEEIEFLIYHLKFNIHKIQVQELESLKIRLSQQDLNVKFIDDELKRRGLQSTS
eukprot:403368734